MKAEAHCDFCNITYDASVDRQVEVRFTVAAHLRDVSDRRFCTGGPMNVPHFVAQVELAPGEERAMALDLIESTYRLRSRQVQGTAIIEVHPDAPETGEVAVVLRSEGVSPSIAASRVGTLHLRLRNETGLPASALLEEPKWPDDAATASILSTFQEFRDLFGSEVLAPGLQLSIQRLAFVFTDLTGSTALYQNVGQARAFRLVQDHFGLLGEPIAQSRGAVVKTVGDAIMAAFAPPRRARRGPDDAGGDARPEHRRRGGPRPIPEDRHPCRAVHRRQRERETRLLRHDYQHRVAGRARMSRWTDRSDRRRARRCREGVPRRARDRA